MPTPKRNTLMPGWRLRPVVIDAVKVFASQASAAIGLVVESLLVVALRHPDEVRAEVKRRREGDDDAVNADLAAALADLRGP